MVNIKLASAGRSGYLPAIFTFLCLFVFSSFSFAELGKDISKDYWQRPVPIQGEAPAGFTPLEASLYPDDCAKCHQSQYRDWSGSLHSKAFGPGLVGQLSPHEEPGFAILCYFCHAPLSEQQEMIETGAGHIKNPYFDKRLQKSGVSCTVCHLREHKRFGPPPFVEKKKTVTHGGFVESNFFEESGFCAACHQFPEGEFSLNGKLLQNTYKEWLASPYPAKGVTCQKCHMPGRRHLFRGIHDPDMVKSGVTIEVKKKKGKGVVLTITNSGAGHYLPTYVTPLIVVKGFLVDKKGKETGSSIKEEYIGRQVPLDLSAEIADTRIPPMGSFVFDYTPEVSEMADRMIFEIWVYPDKFYNEFFKAILNTGGFTSRTEIEKALAATEESSYMIFRREIDYDKR